MTLRPPTLERPIAADGPTSPEALFKEARRRRRRRSALGALAVAAACGLAAGLVIGFTPPPSPPQPPLHRSTPPSADGYSVSTSNGATVRSIELRGISPRDIVSLDNKIWLVGVSSASSSSTATVTRCSVEEVDPVTMHRIRRYLLDACGDYVVSGGGDIFLAVITYISPTNTQSVRIERFDPATGRSVVLAPVDVTVSGSTRAHCELAYANGSLWFWGSGRPPSDSLVEISPATGAVLETFPSSVLPSPGSPRSVLAGQGRNLWLAGAGPGGHEVVEVLQPGQSAPRVVGTAGEFVQWMSTVRGRMWAYAYTIRATPSNVAKEPTANTRFIEFGTHGVVRTVESSSTLSGDGIVGYGSSLFASGVGGKCAGPMWVWRVDGSSGKVTPLAALTAPYETCLGKTGLASADKAAFTFLADGGYPSRLYRVRPVG